MSTRFVPSTSILLNSFLYSSAGLGYALARKFLEAGDNVIICSRSGNIRSCSLVLACYALKCTFNGLACFYSLQTVLHNSPPPFFLSLFHFDDRMIYSYFLWEWDVIHLLPFHIPCTFLVLSHERFSMLVLVLLVNDLSKKP